MGQARCEHYPDGRDICVQCQKREVQRQSRENIAAAVDTDPVVRAIDIQAKRYGLSDLERHTWLASVLLDKCRDQRAEMVKMAENRTVVFPVGST